jgi:hypothetical protein
MKTVKTLHTGQKKNSSDPGETKFRPTSRILAAVILICCFLTVGGMTAGIFRGHGFSFLLGDKSMAEYKAAGPGLPILISCTALILYAWGCVIVFSAVCSLQIKKTTIGRILRSEIKSFFGDDGYDYRIYSVVSYSVNGIPYENQGVHDFYSMNKEAAKEKLKSLRMENDVTVFYDPKNPDLMTLDRKYSAAYGSLFSGAGFIIGGTLLSIFLGILIS